MFVQDLIVLAQAELWDVYVIATPQATKFIDIPLIEKLTNHPVHSEYRHPEEPDVFPKADAIIAAPTTFNTINKWALGITDTLALGILCEYTGAGFPIVAIPCVPELTLARHPAFKKSISLLQGYGIFVLYEPQVYPPMNNVPWETVLQTLDVAISTHRTLLQQKEGSVTR